MNGRADIFTGLLFALCFCTCLVPPLGANLGGYTVEPAMPEDLVGISASEMVEVPFWQLTPYDWAVIAVLTTSPALLFSLEILFFLKIFGFLGFRKIANKNVLDNTSRNSVYCFIRKNPGAGFTEISQKTGVGPGTLRYHLSLLKLMNKITTLKTTRNSRYFENSGSYSVLEQKVLKFLHNEPSRIILEHLLKKPDMTRVELEQALGISGAGVNWHLHRFSDEGILMIAKDGRNARYIINPDAVPYLEKYMPEYRGMVVLTDTILAESVS
ncbi:MAG: winged helix-turn-helix transcriptional regulator [Methanoregula sp.]|jgi:predicted transcriptional regulator|nr:winged helix-turn-helix transcriptional regulator [Methanoregula sp.]